MADERTKIQLERELAKERRLRELADERARKMRQLAEERAAAKPSPASVRAADERVTPTPTPTPTTVAASPASVRAADERVTPVVTPTPVVAAPDPLVALQTSVADSKAQVKAKNIEIATIALEQAINSGDIESIRDAATKLGEAQGLAGSELRNFSYKIAQDAAKGTKPTAPKADNEFTYDYVWRQDVGGPGGKWALVKSPIIKTPTATTTTTITSGATTDVITGGTTTLPFTGTFSTTTLPYTGSTTTMPLTTPMGTTTTSATGLAGLTAERRGIFDVLSDRFSKYGLSSLVGKVRDLIINGATEDTITIQLQETPEYQRRFRANQDRIKKGLSVLAPAEYLNMEDAYRQILRSYGLNQFDTDDYVSQFISNDISAAELSNRVVNAVQRVRNADPAISQTLREFYGIGQNDLVAYVLDPNQQLPKIERQISAAEIGTAARRQGIQPGVAVAEQLAAQGVTQAEAQRGYATIADILPTAEKLSQIYKGVEEEYNLAEAEQEVFNTLASAQRKRQRLVGREVAQFSGQSGAARGSLGTATSGQY